MCRDKNDTQSYVEILRTVRVDTPADMLFVADISQDAEAARAAGKCYCFFYFALRYHGNALVDYSAFYSSNFYAPLRLFSLALKLPSHRTLCGQVSVCDSVRGSQLGH